MEQVQFTKEIVRRMLAEKKLQAAVKFLVFVCCYSKPQLEGKSEWEYIHTLSPKSQEI